MNVKDFIASEAAKPFRWGDTDCICTSNRWVRLCTGIEPLSQMTTGYSDERQANHILATNGGFAVAVNRAMRGSQLKRTVTPIAGDVGLILHRDKLCTAIHAGDYWFSRDASGLIGAPLNSIWKAWTI